MTDASLHLVSKRREARTSTPFVYQEGTMVSLHFEIDAAQSTMDEEYPERLVFSYTRLMMSFLLFEASPAHIGFVGLGGGSLPKYCYRHLPNTRLTVAESNPEVIALRQVFQIPNDGPRLAVLQIDGLEFVETRTNAFDVLMVDAFDMLGQPPHLCTKSFYQACYQSLTSEGILVVNLCHDGSRSARTRIEEVFGRDAICLQAPDGSNLIVIISKGKMRISRETLRLRAKGLELLHSLELQQLAEQVLQCWEMPAILSGEAVSTRSMCSPSNRTKEAGSYIGICS